MRGVIKFGQLTRGLVRVKGSCCCTAHPIGGNAPTTQSQHPRHFNSVYETTKITNKLLDANTLYLLDKYARYSPAAISIKHLLDHGKKFDTGGSFLFLRKEIPTRLANMIMELKLLPEDLRRQPECTMILNDYITSFREMIEYETMDKNDKNLECFIESLNIIRRRHLDTVPTMAQAVLKLHVENGEAVGEGVSDTIQYFLDRLYINRISIHMLISHYNALHGQTTTVTGMVGTIDQKCDIIRCAKDAYESASVLCEGEYFDSPKMKVTALDTTDKNKETAEKVTTTYVPAHLHHILFEVFKNSMRATCEFAERKEIVDLPPIKVRIYKTEEDISIKISDQGGGMNRKTRGKIFNYSYSTAPKVNLSSAEGSYGAGLSAGTLPMHGLGYGLPLSRLYARYFKGDVKIACVDGYGTDAYVYLQRLSHLAQENLPIFNAVSSAKLKSVATQAPDWTDNEKRY